MTQKFLSLAYPVRGKVLAVFFGQLCRVVALLTLVPLSVSFALGQNGLGLRYLEVAALCGGLGAWLGRGPKPKKVQTNEAMVLVALIFLFTPLVMSWPMMESGLGFGDAFFEAISGATTTGLSTVGNLEALPQAVIFGRAWMQWYGGLGVVVLTLAFVLPPGAAARRLSLSDQDEEDLVGGTRLRARRISLIYAGLTLLGVLMLWILGLELFEALVFTLAAVSTGGFAPTGASLAGMDIWGQAGVTLLCLAGALPLAFYYLFYTKRWGKTPHMGQVLSILALAALAAGALAVILALGQGISWGAAWREGLLTAFSAQTTAGFSSMPPNQMGNGGQAAIIFSMFVGGGVASTAGGIKVLRFLVLLKIFALLISRTALAPDAVQGTTILGHKLEDQEVRQTLSIILLAVVLIAASWLPFLVMGHDPMASLFEVVSAFGTVGLSSGITSSTLHPFLKGVLCADMLLGRLEIVAFLVIFYPRTWLGERMSVR